MHYIGNVKKKNTISHRMDEIVLNAHSLRNSQKALCNAVKSVLERWTQPA